MPEVHHTGITVSDLDRSIEFYCSSFGLKQIRRADLAGEALEQAVGVPGATIEVAMLAADNTIVELLQYKTATGAPFSLGNNDAGSAHLCFSVDDIDSVYASLVAKGVACVSAPDEGAEDGPDVGTRFAYVLDPDGMTVELFQAGPTLTLAALGVAAARV